jgi:hypothetical protein
MLSVGDADDLTPSLLVGLGAAHSQEQAARFGLDVGESESCQLGASQRGGEPSRMRAASRAPLGVSRSMPGDDLADLGHAEWAGQAHGCGAESAA